MKGMINILCSQEEFYTVKSYSNLYTCIYICHMQRKYNTYLQNKQENEKIGSNNIEILLCFLREAILRISDLSRLDVSDMSLVRTDFTNWKQWVLIYSQHENCKLEIVSFCIWRRYTSTGKWRHRLASCTMWLRSLS